MSNTAVGLWLLALLGGGCVSLLAWFFGRKGGARMARASTAARLSSLSAERDAAERRAREASAETTRWKGMSLAGDVLTSSPIFEARPAPRDAEELARMVRGLAFIDDVVLADRSGYPLTRESTASSPDLAALAPHVNDLVHRFGIAGLQVTDLQIETADAVHVRARLLSGRCEGAMVLLRSTSQPVSTLVVDAVGHASARTFGERQGRPVVSSVWATSDREAVPDAISQGALATLDRELNGSLDGVSLVLEGRTVYSSAHEGPSAEIRAAATASLHALASRARSTLRATRVAEVRVSLRSGQAVTWSSLPDRSRAALITFGRGDGRSAARLDVLVGKLRRALDTKDAPSSQHEGTAA